MRNKYHNYRVPAELVTTLKHKYGAVAAARDWENNPNKLSNSFEFYIVQNKKGAHHLDGEHTVFGQVIDGFSVIDRIAALKTGQDEWPLDDVFMEIEVLN
jgi:peptidylprolyl isomerase